MSKTKNNIPMKVTILGGGGVGKSSLTLRYMEDSYEDGYDPTIENNFSTKITVEGETQQVDIIDTAGQDEYRGLMDSWIRSSDAFIFCYDISDEKSLHEIEKIIKLTKKHKETELEITGNPFVPSILVGCKCDADEEFKISKEKGKAFAKEQLFIETDPDDTIPYFFETSAKKNINVNEAFEAVVRIYLRKVKYVDKVLSKNTTGKKKKKGLFSSLSTKDDVEDEINI
eukprot:gene8890-840_t